MRKYIQRRLLYAVPMLFGVTVLIFVALRIVPGDVTVVIFGEEGFQRISEEDRQRLISSLGLDEPLPLQYVKWMKEVFTLKLGHSFWKASSVMDTIIRRGPISAEIAILAVIVSWMIGLPVGILAAIKQDTIWDYFSRFFTVLFLAIPNFWLGSVIALFLLIWFGWKSPPGIIYPWENPIDNLKIVWGPVLVLSMGMGAVIARMSRSTLLEVIREDYIRTARAKGLMERTVLLRHAVRNALLPVVTLSGLHFSFLLGGSVVVEQVFGVPGLGTTMIRAFQERDYVVMQNLVLVYGLIFVAANLVIDLAYGLIDPRIRYE